MNASDLRKDLLDKFAVSFKSRFGLKKESLGYFKRLNKEMEVGLTQNNRLWGSDGVEISFFTNFRSPTVFEYLRSLQKRGQS